MSTTFLATKDKDSLSAPNFFRFHEYVTPLPIGLSKVLNYKFSIAASEVWCIGTMERQNQKQFYFTSEMMWQH
jgi:hypothetical protein